MKKLLLVYVPDDAKMISISYMIGNGKSTLRYFLDNEPETIDLPDLLRQFIDFHNQEHPDKYIFNSEIGQFLLNAPSPLNTEEDS